MRYGLCVAIPTVLVFNGLSTRIARYEMGLTNAGSELADRLEVSEPLAAEVEELDESGERASRDEEPHLAIAQA